jgi:hypothetical protein
MMCVLGVRYGVGREAALQRTHEEESQTGRLRHNCSDRQLALVQQVRLILPDVVRTELIWRLAEVAREPLDGADVLAYSF